MANTLELLKAKLAAAKAAGESSTPIAPIAAGKIQTAAQVQQAPTVSAVESSLLVVSEHMKQLEGFDPVAFVGKLAEVRQGVEARAPGIENYFREINKNLNQYSELCHLLNDDQLAALTAGLFYLTDTNMAAAVVTGKSKKNLTINELEAMF